MADVLDLNAEDFVEEDDGNINVLVYNVSLVTLKIYKIDEYCMLFIYLMI